MTTKKDDDWEWHPRKSKKKKKEKKEKNVKWIKNMINMKVTSSNLIQLTQENLTKL